MMCQCSARAAPHTLALCVSSGRFRMESLLCRRTLGLRLATVGTRELRIAFAVKITRCQLIAQLPYSTALPGPLSMLLLLLLRLEDASARQTMMISWCHYSDAGTSHRDREPICFGVQCSKISSARRRMCRSPPCTICLLQYHLHTLSSTDVPTVKRRCGAVG